MPPPWAGLSVMRPKDQNWFGDLVSGLQPRQDPGSGRAVAGGLITLISLIPDCECHHVSEPLRFAAFSV